jgi:hypothetical protein
LYLFSKSKEVKEVKGINVRLGGAKSSDMGTQKTLKAYPETKGISLTF